MARLRVPSASVRLERSLLSAQFLAPRLRILQLASRLLERAESRGGVGEVRRPEPVVGHGLRDERVAEARELGRGREREARVRLPPGRRRDRGLRVERGGRDGVQRLGRERREEGAEVRVHAVRLGVALRSSAASRFSSSFSIIVRKLRSPRSATATVLARISPNVAETCANASVRWSASACSCAAAAALLACSWAAVATSDAAAEARAHMDAKSMSKRA